MTNNKNKLLRTLLNKSNKTKVFNPKVRVEDMWSGFSKSKQDEYTSAIENAIIRGFFKYGFPSNVEEVIEFIEKIEGDMRGADHVLPWGYPLPRDYEFDFCDGQVKLTFYVFYGAKFCTIYWSPNTI